jgi:hypothetical protein
MSLVHIPKGMLDKIRRKCFNFFRTNKWDKEGIPLVNGANKKNEEAGGWSLKNIHQFW